MITFKEFLNKSSCLTKEQKNIIDEAKNKNTPFVNGIWKSYRKIYDELYKLQIFLSKGFTGGKEKKNDNSINDLYDITDRLLKGNDLNFITFSKAIENITK